MVSLLNDAVLAADGDARVLVTGESGVGKELIARHVHAHSPQASAPFVRLRCADLTEAELESKLQLAHRGSLFLDDVAELSLPMQGHLLLLLESAENDARVISATSRDLSELASQRHFRDDLLYRLRVIHLHVPPLRERRDDIRPLAAHFLARAARRVALTDEAWHSLERYGWPGNVRELQNVIRQVVSLSSGDRPVSVEALPVALQCGQSATAGPERRRQVADDLYQAIVSGGYSFWEHIHPLFLNRDITRHDLRELIRRGLKASRGNYRGLLALFRIPKTDYKRFMNFLAAHECRIDYREFRQPQAEPGRFPRLVLPPLAPCDQKNAVRPKAARKPRSR
jgi:DNA-binding NtrC family response regulator